MKLRSSTYLIAVALVLLFVKLEAGVGNEDPRLDRYKLNAFLDEKFGINDDAISPEAVDQFEHMLNKLKVKQTQYRSEMGFLKHLFYTVHRKMLGDYVQYSSFQQIFEKHGYYDCVTASILYAIILDELNIQYEVRETDYHVYLLAIADDQEVFFETTDPMYGFVADPEEVMYRKNFYSGKIPNTEHRDEIIGLASENPEYQNTGHVDLSLIHI